LVTSPAAGLQQIAAYLRLKRRFRSVDELEGHLRQINAPFGQLTDSQWQRLARQSAQQVGDGQIEQHYDPAIARQFYWPPMLDIALRRVWDCVTCPVSILRGEHSDLLLPGTMKELQRRGIAASKGKIEAVEVKGCGHAPALKADDQVALVEDFLVAAGADAAESRRHVAAAAPKC
jgi:pimeloyl-ACP methyl ester carboxylesterase